MNAVVIWLAMAGLAAAATPKITFTKSFPGSVPDFVQLDIDQTGALTYREAVKDDQPLRAQLSHTEAALLFSLAESLDHFKMPLESDLKVANTGKKVFRYEDENGAASQAVFNYSTNPAAQQLLDRFEQIAASERAFLELDRAMHFDKLGVNDALAQIELLWLHKQLAAPQQFVPLLQRVSTHATFMHLARERAARLKDQFQGSNPPPAPDPITK